MANRKRVEPSPSEKILQHLTLIQASLQRIEEWLARIAGVRIHLPAAERFHRLLSWGEVYQLGRGPLGGLAPRATRDPLAP